MNNAWYVCITYTFYIIDQPINEENNADVSEDEHISEDIELIVPVNKVDVSTQYESSKQEASTQCGDTFKADVSTQCGNSFKADASTQCGNSFKADASTQCEGASPQITVQPIVEMKSEAIQIDRPDIIHEVVQTDELEEENEVTPFRIE